MPLFTRISPDACDVAVMVLEFTFMVLVSRVSIVSLATNVLVPVGMVTVPALDIVDMMGKLSVLFESVSVVDLPTNVSLAELGSVRVNVLFLIWEMVGVVRVLFVRISGLISPENRLQTPPVNLYVLPVSISKKRD